MCDNSMETSAKLVPEHPNVDETSVRKFGKLKLPLEHHIMKFQAFLTLKLSQGQCLPHTPAVLVT